MWQNCMVKKLLRAILKNAKQFMFWSVIVVILAVFTVVYLVARSPDK